MPAVTMPQYQHRFAIAACARWESRYLAEWLTYHRAIGFEHVYLYCNDDEPETMYQAVLPFIQGSEPFVTFRFYPRQGEHRKTMLDFIARDLPRAEWVSFLDIDEFMRLPAGQLLAEFMAGFEPIADCVLFNWLWFGPNGHKTPPAAGVLSACTRREAVLHPFTKYVARSAVLQDAGIFRKVTDNGFVHWLSPYSTQPIRSVNVLGEDMSGYSEGFPEAAARFARDPARHDRIIEQAVIQHYPFRSEQAFMERAARGLGGDHAGQDIWSELAQSADFQGYLDDLNAVEDRRLANFWRQMSRPAWDTDVTAKIDGKLLSQGRPAQLAAGPYAAPAWQVDLGAVATIREILIYRSFEGTALQPWRFSLLASIDGETWAEIGRRDGTGNAEEPAAARHCWVGPGMAWARFIRLAAWEPGDAPAPDKIEIYGQS